MQKNSENGSVTNMSATENALKKAAQMAGSSATLTLGRKRENHL